MTAPISYTFAVLRYYHDIAAGECVNVGVAVYAPGARFLGLRCTNSVDRPARIFPDINHEAFRAALSAIEMSFASLARQIVAHPDRFSTASVSELANSVLRPDDSSLKWSSSGSGITTNPEHELDWLFNRLVRRYEVDALGSTYTTAGGGVSSTAVISGTDGYSVSIGGPMYTYTNSPATVVTGGVGSTLCVGSFNSTAAGGIASYASHGANVGSGTTQWSAGGLPYQSNTLLNATKNFGGTSLDTDTVLMSGRLDQGVSWTPILSNPVAQDGTKGSRR